MVALSKEENWGDFSLGVTASEYEQLQTVINRQVSYNGWFTKENVRRSLFELGSRLSESELQDWASQYAFAESPKKVLIVMAGNIPLVGFHDFLSVLISGNSAACKLSSDDKTLLPALAGHLLNFLPSLKERIEFTAGKTSGFDAVIATGSDNSMKYFEQYFGKYPHIFRKNRTSVAVLSGEETKDELEKLGDDIFGYFGLGCRNVSHLIVPSDFDLNRFFEGIFPHGDVINNNKYGNNYDYNKAVYLMNQHELLDNNFVLLRESEQLFSPLSMIHYHRYSEKEQVNQYLSKYQTEIQVVVGKGYQSFGTAQSPSLNDYADGIDTMKWLDAFNL